MDPVSAIEESGHQIKASAYVGISAPPIRFLTGWTHQSPDKRPALLALGLLLMFAVVVVTPDLGHYFGLFPVGPGVAIYVGMATTLWVLALRAIWRAHLFERFLSWDHADERRNAAGVTRSSPHTVE
jgi:hypothetical protein